MRAEGASLYGRMIDAGSGHAVRGRHPWRYTSTLAVPAFAKAWRELQRDLEQRLGLKPLVVAGFPSTPRGFDLRMPPRSKPREAMRSVLPPPIPQAEVEVRLRDVDPQGFSAVFESEQPDRVTALDLVRALIRRIASEAPDRLMEWAESACELIRRKTGIPVFAGRPRARFARDWMIDASALQTLAWFEAHALPAFDRELLRMPASTEVETAVEGEAKTAQASTSTEEPEPDAGSSAEEDEFEPIPRLSPGGQIELGRLIMVAVWRLGLTRQPVLESFLKWALSDRPILAAGSFRYLVVKIPCRRTSELMTRVVALDDFCCAYLLIERKRLRGSLRRVFEVSRARRNAQLRKALESYLESIGVQLHARIALPQMMQAAVQRIMLDSSPLLAAYSCGEFETHDLGDREIRRLAGLMPQRTSAGVDSSAAEKGTADRDADDAVESDREVDNLPEDLKSAKKNLAYALTDHPTANFDELNRRIADVPAATNREGLLKSFALSLLKQEEPSLIAGEVPTKVCNRWKQRVRIVAYAFLGMADTAEELRRFDEPDLERLIELTSEHFPNRASHGAWRAFKSFLVNSSKDERCEVEIGELGGDTEYVVSAKVLPAAALEQIDRLLQSPLAGISNPDFRYAARKLARFIGETGARRGEVEHLRCQDVQGDLIRLQPYDDHTLKTAWSERIVPVGFLTQDTRDWIKEAKDWGLPRLIDPRPGVSVEGHNIFDAINRVIKKVGCDKTLGQHHLRHTLPSRLCLSVLDEAVHLNGIDVDLPWVQPLLITDDRLQCLLGGEGASGHGLQAISALLGHSHPTTTLCHYIHTLFVAFFAYQAQNASRVDIAASFENRVRSPKTVQLWAAEARRAAKSLDDPVCRNAAVNRRIRFKVEQLYKNDVDFDERPIEQDADVAEMAAAQAPATASTLDEINFHRFVELERALRRSSSLPTDPFSSRIIDGLIRLALVPSGKRGAKMPRHPLAKGDAGIPLPAKLAEDTTPQAAVALCRYLDQLRVDRPEDFEWLVRKWARYSEQERGRMLLVGHKEQTLASLLPVKEGISIEVKRATVTSSRKERSKAAVRMRVLVKASSSYDRDIEAIRWVMTWVAAMFWGCWQRTSESEQDAE